MMTMRMSWLMVVPCDVVSLVVQGVVVHMMNISLRQMDCREVNKFQAIVHKCRIDFGSTHNAMVKIPLIEMACYDRERGFCKHPNFYCVL